MTLPRALTDPASTGSWTLVPDRSSIKFSSKTLWGLVPVNGRFPDVTGEGTVGADGAVSGRLQIRAASVKTGIGKRDEHLCSPDFF
ncbi:MAG: YceI family protein, partial [Mycobacterium sp.]